MTPSWHLIYDRWADGDRVEEHDPDAADVIRRVVEACVNAHPTTAARLMIEHQWYDSGPSPIRTPRQARTTYDEIRAAANELWLDGKCPAAKEPRRLGAK